MTTSTDKTKGIWLFALLSLLAWLPSAMWAGFALSQVWSWFIVPLGVPTISMWHAAGIAIVGADVSGMLVLVKGESDQSYKARRDRLAMTLTKAALAPLFVLAFGWVYHSLWMHSL